MPTQVDIEQQKKMLDAHRTTLAYYVLQQAQLGSGYAPPGIITGIAEARSKIRRVKNILRDWGVEIEDLPDDLSSESSERASMDVERSTGLVLIRKLREPVPDFVDRKDHIERITELIEETLFKKNHQRSVVAIICVRGVGGGGKTELAHAVTQQLAPHFPDGCIFIDLRGVSRKPLGPKVALQTLIRPFYRGITLPDDLSELHDWYHTALYEKRMLILADDAWDALQVEPLLPPRRVYTSCHLSATISIARYGADRFGSFASIRSRSVIAVYLPTSWR